MVNRTHRRWPGESFGCRFRSCGNAAQRDPGNSSRPPTKSCTAAKRRYPSGHRIVHNAQRRFRAAGAALPRVRAGRAPPRGARRPLRPASRAARRPLERRRAARATNSRTRLARPHRCALGRGHAGCNDKKRAIGQRLPCAEIRSIGLCGLGPFLRMLLTW